MAYKLMRTTALEGLREYTVGVIAGLKAVKGLESLAAPWQTAKANIVKARDARDDARDAECETTAHVRVADAQWDRAVVELSGLTFLVSGKDAKAEPYAQLFGTLKAEKLKKLGPAKATAAGAELVEKLGAIRHPQLGASAKELDKLTKQLAAAEEADAAAELAALTHEIERVKLLRRLEVLIAETEARILAKFPGDEGLVRAILSTVDMRKGGRSEAEEADSATG
jgi:hypothetical protein